MKNSLIKEKIKNINSNYTHPSYIYERKMLNDIKMGNLREAMVALENINSGERPLLAKNYLRSLKNSLIASCTLFTRAAIEAGVDSEDAFDLSDVFIQHLEELDDPNIIRAFEFEMLQDFVRLIQNNITHQYAYPISKVIKFIYDNTTERITVSELAGEFNLSSDYLSRLFCKEVGVHLTDFIQQRKIDLAKSYLEFSELSITDLSALLDFCNPAYFTNVFKKHTDVSPNTYRKQMNQFL